MKAKNLISLLVGIGIGLVAGAIVITTEIFPYSVLKPIATRADRLYAQMSDPESWENRNTPVSEQRFADTADVGFKGEDLTFDSQYLEGGLVIPGDVFWPNEAEVKMLPIMSRNKELFEGKSVMEIGTGSGIVSLYAAQLGATKVVGTDISPEALEAARANAERLGLSDVVEFRQVPLDDMSAFSVIGEDEQFDVIISNPPYALDLDAPINTAAVDTGDLGFSIVRGLDQHLTDDGVAILFYGSIFYHGVMVKFAEYEGFDVRNHPSNVLFNWEAETLFNSYMGRLLERENVDPNAFVFDYEVDPELDQRYYFNEALTAARVERQRLFPGERGFNWYPGMIVIRKAD